ncbi:Maternal protein tudor, partial [Pseudolycoriella hygida]
MEIPMQPISLNKNQEVKLTWLFSPLDFYVTTIKSDADLEYTSQMKNIHHFYKNKSPFAKRVEVGSLVIAKYSKNNQLHRAKIIEFNEQLNKYKAQLIDFGALTIVDAEDVYEMDKIFAKLECQAIKCSFDGVALSASRFDMEETIEKMMTYKKLDCRFIKKKGDTFYVDITADGLNVKSTLIKAKFLSILDEGIELERLVGQTVMAEVKSFNDLSSFRIIIYGCGTLFEVSCKNAENKPIGKKLSVDEVIPIRIESLALGKSFVVSPLIDTFGEAPPSPICNVSFFSNNFKAVVTHWKSYNVAYIQSEHVSDLSQKLLDDLYSFYDKSGDLLREFTPQTLCAAKSADENWYRAEIVSETQSHIEVRYLDYGNCESIPKNLIKCLESKFCKIPALAVKVYLPLNKAHNDGKVPMDEIAKLTEEVLLNLKVLGFHEENWIVDLLNDNTSITDAIKTKTSCKTITVNELKKQITDVELSQKASRLNVQKPKVNQQVETKTAKTEVTQPTTETENTQAPSQQLAPSDNRISLQASTTSPRTKAAISHIDRPDRFYLQISSSIESLYELQENIQIVAPSLPPLDDFSNETRCIVRYSVDMQWYRAVIIDSDRNITSILFIDYGNTDSITDNSLIKSMSDAFDKIPPYAIPCALPLEAKDRIEWSEESCDLFKNLMKLDEDAEFEFVCKGKSNNFVKLYQGELDVMEKFIQNGHAIRLDSITSGSKCYVSHVNSISDFYIQMESDTNALEKLADYLLDESKFAIMTDVKEGVVCSAKYLDDGLWYRGKIKSHNGDGTEVCFIDYGNSSITNEVRIVPTEIANIPALAKYCSLVKPKDVQYWSESAEKRFVELTDNGGVFMVDVISPGKKSIVDLISNEKSILEEISQLCDKYTVSALERTLQSSADNTITPETFKATIVDGSPNEFYIQLESNTSELDKVWVSMESASTWPTLETVEVGQMCAALYDEYYYRAKVLSVGVDGVTVHYIDYGNQSSSSDLRRLPDDLQNIKELAICCALQSQSGIYTPQLIERFANLSKDVAMDFKYISENSNPAIVQLFDNGVQFTENANIESTEHLKIKAYISDISGPNHFYIQKNNEIEALMTSASEWPLMDASVRCVGKRCAALWDGAYYRAEIIAVDEKGTKVHFIDYGNESYATDIRRLPEDLERIERASMLCTLDNQNERFSDEFIQKFVNLSCDDEYEFEIVKQSSPCVVRLYVNGEIFSDGNVDGNIPKSSHAEAYDDSFSILNQVIEEVIEDAIDSEKSKGGTRATNNSTTITN